jgi:S-adenosylmethionine-diacylglycerol 3-amino-3-carboxypropyl transferase
MNSIDKEEGTLTVPHTYFSELNYSLANEDAGLEQALAQQGAHIMCIAGSGGRLIPLLAQKPRMISFVDVAGQQIALTKLRLAALRELKYNDFLGFFGYTPQAAETRRAQFEQLLLADETRDILGPILSKAEWAPIIYMGRFERLVKKFAGIFQNLFRIPTEQLCSFDSLAEQKEFYRNEMDNWRWHLSLRCLANAKLFNSLLYRGHFPKKNLPLSHYQFFYRTFSQTIDQHLARENFFLQLCFLGEIAHQAAFPPEAKPDLFQAAKAHLEQCPVHFYEGDILSQAHDWDLEPLDFFSFSDVPSYLRPPEEQSFLQQIRPLLAPEALVLCRYYLRIPEQIDKQGFQDLAPRYRQQLSQEKTGIYHFDLLQKRP